jgi:LysM domain-containing protein
MSHGRNSRFVRVFAAAAALTAVVSGATAQAAAAASFRQAAHHMRRDASPRWVTVQPGDTLSGIAGRQCGASSDWTGIYRANRKIIGGNPNMIRAGQRLRLDCAQQAVTVSFTEGGSIVADVYQVFGDGGGCALEILNHESGTSLADVTIENPSTGAYGLPQALPGGKMASAGADWATNPVTQLQWMLGYVDSTYGGVCNAAAHDLSTGSY